MPGMIVARAALHAIHVDAGRLQTAPTRGATPWRWPSDTARIDERRI